MTSINCRQRKKHGIFKCKFVYEQNTFPVKFNKCFDEQKLSALHINNLKQEEQKYVAAEET